MPPSEQEGKPPRDNNPTPANRFTGWLTSWIGQLTALAGAITLFATQFTKVDLALSGLHNWRYAIYAAAALLLLLSPLLTLRDRLRKKIHIEGPIKPGYFTLSPREDEIGLERADGVHEEIRKWLEARAGVLYLTGLSGAGKSSLLASWVLPKLTSSLVIRLRGYQEPVAAIEKELRKPNTIWKNPPDEACGARSLLEKACKHIKPKRLLIVLDQFEEFMILQDPAQRQVFQQLLASVVECPIEGLTFLLVFRSDYIGLIERLELPPLLQNGNWKEVPPFTEAVALEFVRGSGLRVSEDLLKDVLREAAEIDRTKGLIRPITINLSGMVLSRFATGLHGGFRPGGLIRGFLRESISLPAVRDVAPLVIPKMITESLTKKPPQTIDDLTKASGVDAAAVQQCLWALGQSDRGIVRALGENQQKWEIAHDFLVPLLDSIVARWTVSLWRRSRPWLPWIAAAGLTVAAAVVSGLRDPVHELTEAGWTVSTKGKKWDITFDGTPPPESRQALRRIPATATELSISGGLSDVSALKDLKYLTTLNLRGTRVSDVSPLKDLTNLTSLDLRQTPTREVTALKGLTNLTLLDLSFNQVSDVSPLKDLTNLKSLDLQQTPVRELTALKDLKCLTTLNLRGTRVGDVSPLKDLTNLTSLDLRQTPTREVTALKGLTNLTLLDLSFTQVSDVSPLRGLKSLKYLELSFTKVSDVSPLKDLTSLTSLDLLTTQVRDVSPLKDLKSLTHLDLRSTQVRDVSALKDLKHLEIEKNFDFEIQR